MYSGSEPDTEQSPDPEVPQDKDDDPTAELGMWIC
jgi:hypothetical protein